MTVRKVVLTKVIAAPPARVFQVCTRPELLALWLGHDAFEVCEVQADARVGGRLSFRMRGELGLYGATGVFQEVVPDRRLVLAWTWVEGPPGQAADGVQSLVTIELAPADGGTRLTLTHAGLPTPEQANDHEQGWRQSLEKLGRVALSGSIAGAGT